MMGQLSERKAETHLLPLGFDAAEDDHFVEISAPGRDVTLARGRVQAARR